MTRSGPSLAVPGECAHLDSASKTGSREPAPLRPGQVIGYRCLWAREHRSGIEEGSKDRPCAIVATRQVIEGRGVGILPPLFFAHVRDRIVQAHIQRRLSRVEQTEQRDDHSRNGRGC